MFPRFILFLLLAACLTGCVGSPPRDVRAALVGSADISLSWKNPEAAISGLRIEERLGDGEWSIAGWARIPSDQLLLPHRDPGKRYGYRVVAIYAFHEVASEEVVVHVPATLVAIDARPTASPR